MSADMEDTSQPFNLDAILQEFNIINTSQPTKPTQSDSPVARVRESFGLGRSLFRRKEVKEQDDEGLQLSSQPTEKDFDEEPEKSHKPKRRIVVDSDDEDDVQVAESIVHRRLKSPGASDYGSDTEKAPTPENNDSDSDDDMPLTDKILADFRKARLEALSAKVAEKNRKVEDEAESANSERSLSPVATSYSRSQSPVERKPKARRASKKALEEMNRETQRMARNMVLRPEIKVAKKIDMNSVFAKFGFNLQKSTEETTATQQFSSNQVCEPSAGVEDSSEAPKSPITGSGSHNNKIQTVPVAPPKRFATPDLNASDSDDSLPSPSKLFASLFARKPKSPTPNPTPKKVQFAVSQPGSDSDSDSDVEIIPPKPDLPTNIATPARKRIRQTALIKFLANVKSPSQIKPKSPGRMTQKELDAVLSREAAAQLARKREERKAELKSLGIDTDKIVGKRDFLEEAREEAKRIREEEGGEESEDEEYIEEDDNDADEEDEGSEDEEDEGEEEAGEEAEDTEMEDNEMADSTDEQDRLDEISPREGRRKHRNIQIFSDDEEDLPTVPNTTTSNGLQTTNTKELSEFRSPKADSLTQFFVPTQKSSSPHNQLSQPSTQMVNGLTQFFVSTAMDNDPVESDEVSAHNNMDILRQRAAESITDLGDESIGFPAVSLDTDRIELDLNHAWIASPPEASGTPVARRILKRKPKSKAKAHDGQLEGSEEFKKSRQEFIEEQAEESEDDYAAWGSGDESENENMDGVVDGLIDDDTKVKKNDEREVARLYMERELEQDEKFVQGLMNDLQNGGLRRRRGGALEMGDWDSEDDDDNAEERRRRWELKREEMKRRMLEDEALGKLAANPKTEAFFNAISSTTMNFDDEPDFLGETEIIEDRKVGLAARTLSNSIPIGDSQSQSHDQYIATSAEIQVPATNSGDLPRHERDRLIIDELTQIEDSQQPVISEDLSLSEASDSDLDGEPSERFTADKVYTGFIDRAAQKRAARTVSETTTRFAFKAVNNSSSPMRTKRTAVSVIEADDQATRKKVMKEVMGSKTIKRKAWGGARGRGAVTYRGSGGRGKENYAADVNKKSDNTAEKRRSNMLKLMDSQDSFC